MEQFSEYIMAGVGLAISTITFFLKKEAKRLTDLEKELNTAHDSLRLEISSLEQEQARNETRDCERWERVQSDLKRFEGELEKRRQQEIKMWDKLGG